MVRSKYIQDILTLLLDDDDYSLLRKQVDFIEEDSYEYTESGVFVSFKHEQKISNYKYGNRQLRLNGVLIKSDEIDIGAEASVVIDNGIIDYLEIWPYGDIYPRKDLVYYTLEQQWKDGKNNKTVIR